MKRSEGLARAREIRRRYKTGMETQEQLADAFNMDQSSVSLIITNKRWKEDPVVVLPEGEDHRIKCPSCDTWYPEMDWYDNDERCLVCNEDRRYYS